MGVGLVVACTNRKAVETTARLRDVRRSSAVSSLGQLFDGWTRRIADERVGRVTKARVLYSGVAWAASRDAAVALASVSDEASTWVLSAGYGLVSDEDELVPYAATFSPGKADSVARTSAGYRAANQRWWQHLSMWRPEGITGPRTFADLAKRVDALLVVMSPRYLLAAEADLLAAADSGTHTVIVSGGLPRGHALAGHAVEFDKRLREPEDVTGAPRLLRASDMSLNQRVAEHLICELGMEAFDLHAANAYLENEMSKRHTARTYDHRDAASDDEVLEFIESALVESESASKTRLLRDWRASGRQCEQKRFGRLFDQAKEAVELAGLARQEELAL